MSGVIRLIVGLGNPGNDYRDTRHNVGFWLVDQLAGSQNTFSSEKKFSADVAKISLAGHPLWLLKPMTFMNRSGIAIKQMASFYKIETDQILVVHDDLDLQPGTAKIKKGGGHGGHNGLRDTINQLQSKDFYRLRIGIGHPGHKSQVSNYVLHSPGKQEQTYYQQAIDNALGILHFLLEGNIDLAMNKLHSQ